MQNNSALTQNGDFQMSVDQSMLLQRLPQTMNKGVKTKKKCRFLQFNNTGYKTHHLIIAYINRTLYIFPM